MRLPSILEAWITIPVVFGILLGWGAGGPPMAAVGLAGGIALAGATTWWGGNVKARMPHAERYELGQDAAMLMFLSVLFTAGALWTVSYLPIDRYAPASLGGYTVAIGLILALGMVGEGGLLAILAVGVIAVMLAFRYVLGIQGPAPEFGVVVPRPEGAMLGVLWEAMADRHRVPHAGLEAANTLGPAFLASMATAFAVHWLFEHTRTSRGGATWRITLAMGALLVPLAGGIVVSVIQEPRTASEEIAVQYREEWHAATAAACRTLRIEAADSIATATTGDDAARVTRDTERRVAQAGCAP